MVKNIKKSFLLLLFASMGYLSYAQDNIIDQVIWVVGDEAILKSDVEDYRADMVASGQRIEGDPYCFIPEQLAVQKLYLDQAKIDSISITDADLNRQVSFVEKNYLDNLGSKEKIEEFFKMSMSDFREKLKEQQRTRYLVDEVRKKLVGKVNLTPSEVRRYYSQLSKDSLPYVPTTVEVQIITHEPKIPVEVTDGIKERLRGYTNRVNSGETDFSTLAIMYSEDGSAQFGGELGFKGRAELVPEFSSVAFSLSDPKKVSNIVETEYGFHIMQLIERRGDRVNVRHILLKPQVPQADIDKSVVLMDSLISDIRAKKFTFEDATALSFDKDTRKNNGLMVNRKESVNYGTSRFIKEELPPEVAKAVDNMNVGEISAPFTMISANGKEIVAIVKLKSKVDGHVANVSDDYQTLKEIVENNKKDEVLKKWLQTKIKETYVSIDEAWKNCDFQYSGWIKEN